MLRSKTRSITIIRRLKKEAHAAQQTLKQLEHVLPLYEFIPPTLYHGMQLYLTALTQLEESVRTHPSH